jgi:hypothetical protein
MSLDKAYQDAIERLEAQLPDDSALAKTVLSWITYAQRLLTVDEVCHALAVEYGKDNLDFDNILSVNDIVSVCAGLITVDKESNIIRLVHYTTQEYLERVRESWIPDAQQEIASTCLTYLSFRSFSHGSCPSNVEFKSRLEQYPLLDYAARFWGIHARSVQEQVSEVAHHFLRDSSLLSSAVQAMSVSGYRLFGFSEYFPKQTTGLHLTARFGLLSLCTLCLMDLIDMSGGYADLKNSYGTAPLSYAAANGHEAVVKLLVERDDVEADSKDKDGGTPLSFAAENGHEAVVRLLVERDDVEADLKDKDGRTPLSYAAAYGHEAVVRLLVERDDVEADSKDKNGRTPLSCAAANGHEAVVDLLKLKLDHALTAAPPTTSVLATHFIS